ncbi:Acg family FMN-binding oxidoreductase [Haloactinomyces albus]|uniref:Nitroreductase n=1 Tax=Haloactinomyces albus TaxID=1352928 RepID=A0AAE3Z9K0_9ACTN|nr:nitroreductase family protein [Haloactinomyces albus]MDR7300843.1 nitroreductase [Haloactinomyces albus]
MRWRRTKPRHGAAVAGQPWTSEDIATLERTVDRAPSVHNTRPWSLTVQDRAATLHERTNAELEQHDPEGRDRRLSCGAALTNLILAVRNLGWATETRREHSPDPPDEIAAVLGSHREPPNATEGQRYRAIIRRTSYRRVFEPRAVSYLSREALLAAATSPTVFPRWVTMGEAPSVAELLAYAARVRRKDRSYQRELAMWTVGAPGEVAPGEGVPADAFGTEGVPAVGLTTSATRVPDEQRLAAWIETESLMVLSTASEDYYDHVSAGMAMQLAWLAATSLGLVASVMTQPLHLTEVRSGLRERLGLPGEPQLLMRFGYPAAVPGPRRP